MGTTDEAIKLTRQQKRAAERAALKRAVARNPASAPLPRAERRKLTGEDLAAVAAFAAQFGLLEKQR